MFRKSFLAIILLMTLMLVACGGGGGKGEGASSSSASSTALPFPLNIVIANARFLLFPNAQKQGFAGVDETNTVAYATAYYAAIDASGKPRSTLDDWKATNGFTAVDSADQVTVIFGDKNDLGYGRRMTARKNADGSLAFMVENYLVDTGSSTGYTYSNLNVDAAVVGGPSTPRRHFVSVSAIEYGDLDGPGFPNDPKFVRFYVFGPDGVRKNMVDQDGLGEKAMPNICVNCHGGRADPLTTANAFPVVANALSQKASDTTSRLQALKVHTFDFSSLNPSFIRSAQEGNMRKINEWVHDSYTTTGINEWDGTVAKAFIQKAYDGHLATSTATYNDNSAMEFMPSIDWQTNAFDLYKNTVGPVCMTCHILRGTKNSPADDISFTTFTQFNGYADRIKAHVFDRGNMPLAKIVFQDFWGAPSKPTAISAFLDTTTFPADKSGGITLKPGRPLADPGPDRFVRQVPIPLNAINSLYATGYAWTVISQNGGAVLNANIANPSAASTTFTATFDATYVVRLTVTGNGLSNSKDLTIKVDSINAPNPANLNFSAIKNILADPVVGCQANCHQGNGNTLSTIVGRPPLSYDIADYGIDDDAFYKTVKGRINFTDVAASPLLRKPSGNHHSGSWRPGFNTNFPLGDTVNRGNYDFFVEWIMAGAPQ